MRSLSDGLEVEKILADSVISEVVKQKRAERDALRKAIEERMIVHNRLAVVRHDGLGMRSNGYQVTAMAGDSCDACIIVHGDLGVSLETRIVIRYLHHFTLIHFCTLMVEYSI